MFMQLYIGIKGKRIRKEDIVMNHSILSNQKSVLLKRNTYTKRINNWKTCYSNRDYCDHNNRIQSVVSLFAKIELH
jgi:hypothetical protein